MIVLVCDNVLKKGVVDEVKAYYEELVEYTRRQPGCLAYDVYQSQDRKEALIFVERWENEEYLDAHLKDPVYLEMFEKIEKYLEEDEVVHMYHEFAM